ncbi:tripartite tricarboxylate transporter permease [Pseudonocardia nematodicida]|uniref:Tripartite tricarboxylate transporter permease n=1 Tax=Pseudonocardia nematodicida TaxID=1206997 RepID=A0ABV1KHB0_9PSEU
MDDVLLGLTAVLQPQLLLFCLLGVTLGTLVGVMPGIGSLAAVSLLIPISFHVPPDAALILLAGVYYGTLYGGSTASILLNLPGSPSSAVACFDGYPMAKQGRAGLALSMTTIGSFVGAAAGIVLMIALAPTIAGIGLMMTAADYFALLVVGLVASLTLASGSKVKGLAMMLVGIMLGFVGTDSQTGQERFTFGSLYLADGINLVALSIGLFGLSEVIAGLTRGSVPVVPADLRLRSLLPTRSDLRRSVAPMGRGTALGAFVGALPGAGTNVASFMSYVVEKRVSKTPERFGKGALEGVVAPETSNNAAAQTAFIPTMTLGVPGDATMALLLGVLIMHGIQPGPTFVAEEPEMFWALIMSFWIGNLLLVVLNLPLIGVWVRILAVPRRVLMPTIVVLMCVGVYSINNSALDIVTMAFFGAIGYLLLRRGFEVAPLVLGFILGPLTEEYLRRALTLARGDVTAMVSRPSTAAILGVAAVLLVVTLARGARPRTRLPAGTGGAP